MSDGSRRYRGLHRGRRLRVDAGSYGGRELVIVMTAMLAVALASSGLLWFAAHI